jgi:altronate dehydratase
MTERTINAILISSIDDVVTVITELTEADRAVFLKNGEITQVPSVGTIPKYHKLAIRDIKRTEPLRKYGEIIGQATQDISQGSHVHDHNLASRRWEQ